MFEVISGLAEFFLENIGQEINDTFLVEHIKQDVNVISVLRTVII